jgi:hypothetical protein
MGAIFEADSVNQNFLALFMQMYQHHKERSYNISRQAMYVLHNTEERSCNHCCSEKAMCYIFWVCVCRLRYPVCTAHAPFCHLWPARLYSIFPYGLLNVTIFGRKLRNMKYVLWFSLQRLSEKFLIMRRIEQHMIKMYIGLHVECPLFVSDFNETWILTTDFRKILQYQILWKSIQWEPSWSMRTGGHDANSRFSQFCKCAYKR